MRANSQDLPEVALYCNMFYFNCDSAYFTDDYMDVFDYVVDACIDKNVEPQLWIEAQFYVASYIRPLPKRLHPNVFLGDKAFNRYEQFIDDNKKYAQIEDGAFSRFRKLKEAERKYWDVDVKLNIIIYRWFALWMACGSRKLATQVITREFKFLGEDFKPKFDKGIAKKVVYEFFVCRYFHSNIKSWEKLFMWCEKKRCERKLIDG